MKVDMNLKMNKVKFDLHYLKTISIIIGSLVATFLYFSSDNNNVLLEEQTNQNIEKINQLDSDIKKNKSDLKKFNEKIVELDKFFVKDKEDFGLYKLMEHLDNEIKIYQYKYSTDQKMTNLTNMYFSYTFKFVINYESFDSMQKILDTIENKYHNSFVDAKFDKGKFLLTYKFYGKKASK